MSKPNVLRKSTNCPFHSFIFCLDCDTQIIELNSLSDSLLPIKLLCAAHVMPEYAHYNVELLKVLLFSQDVLLAILHAQIVQAVSLQHLFVMHKEYAQEQNSQVVNAQSDQLDRLILSCHGTKSTFLVSSINEHQEDFKDQVLILVATRHLYHEQEDA